MSDTRIVGYKKMFGFILPDWITEKMIKIFIFGLLTCLIEVFVYIFVINPKFADIKNMENNLQADKTELDSLKKSLDGINKMQDDLTNDKQRKILSAIPSSYSPDTAIFILRELASQTGASIVSYSLPSGVLLDSSVTESIGAKGEMVDFKAYPLKMVIAAPVDILLKFISKVETSLPFGLVSDLNLQEITKLAKTNTNNNVLISLEIKYFQVKINKININKIVSLTPQNIDFASKLGAFDEITIDTKNTISTVSATIATGSGDIFGL